MRPAKVFRSIINRFFPKRPKIVRSVEEWFQARSSENVTRIRPSLDLSYHLPDTVGELDTQFIADQKVHLPERYLVTLEGAEVRGRDGYVVLPDGAFCLENTSEKWLLGNPAYFQRFQSKPVFHAGDFYSLMSMHCREHYHWFHDVLTAIHGVGQFLPPTTRFLIPEGTSAERVDTLKAVGISKENLFFYNPANPIRPERLHFAPPAAPHRFDNPGAIKWLRDRLHDHYKLQPRHDLQLYLPRMATPTRRISNESEVREILINHGFMVVEAGELSLNEQAKLFSKAEVIVGPHGGGLTNMLFSKSGCQILDITAGEIGFRTYFWSLANACKHQYFHLRGEAVEGVADPEEFLVDLEKLKRSLVSMNLSDHQSP